MSRRIIGIVAAVVLAAVGTGVLVLYVQNAEQRALAGERTVDVLVVQSPVRKGTTAESLSGLVESTTIPVKVQALDSVGSLDEIAGRVASVDLVPGEQIVATRFVDPAELARTGSVDLPDGLQEVTISLSPDRAVGGRLVPGDTVGVFLSFEPFDIGGAAIVDEVEVAGQTPNTTHLSLHKVLVTNVQGEALPTPDDDDDTAGNPAPSGSYLITLALDSDQAERVVFTAEFGTVWLSNEPETAVEDGTEIRTRGNVYP